MAASITSSGVVPRKAIRRYVAAGPVTLSAAPKACTSASVSRMPATVVTAPMPTASQSPSMPWARAPRRSPAPSRRATPAVVP